MESQTTENTTSTAHHGDVDGGAVKSLLRQFDFVVVTCILVLAILLGVLNNLRVADERKVKWFGASADRSGQETAQEVVP